MWGGISSTPGLLMTDVDRVLTSLLFTESLPEERTDEDERGGARRSAEEMRKI